jgi:hypothetical protein
MIIPVNKRILKPSIKRPEYLPNAKMLLISHALITGGWKPVSRE